MNLNRLECFIVLGTQLSFSKTAKELNIAQSAVSRQIRLLEEELEADLFIRTPHGVRFTPVGETYFKQIKQYLGAIKSTSEKIITQSQIIRGPIRIACLTDWGQEVAFPIILRFQRMYPEVTFHIELTKASEIEHKLMSGQIDFGISHLKLDHEVFKSYKLCEEEIILVCNKNVSTAKISFDQLQIVTYREQDSLTRTYFKNKLRITKAPSPTLSINSRKSMVEALLQGPYFGVVPKQSVSEDLKSGRLKQAHSSVFHQSIYLVTHNYLYKDQRISTFQKFFVDQIKTLS